MPRSQSTAVDELPQSGLTSVSGRAFPLRSAKVSARARAGVARTLLTQRYANPYDEPLEVVYTMPLPADGAVTGYTIRIGDTVITGEVEKREDAEKTYQRALEEGRTAGLLEQERADTFSQRLGSVPPGEDVQVEIEVIGRLAFLAARRRWEYRFPTVVAVRYEGPPGRVPDAPKLDAPRADASGTPTRLELDMSIDDGPAVRIRPRSASHALSVAASAADDEAAHLTFDKPQPLDRDIVVEWDAVGDGVAPSLTVGPGLAGDDGRYGLLTITPPEAPAHTFARDLTIMIDASGSMIGEPLAAAKHVVEAILRSLEPRDRFRIHAFASHVEKLVATPTDGTDAAVDAAIQKLQALQAGGGTEMKRAVHEALVPLRADSQNQVILLTDGYIGFEEEVVARILDRLPPNSRLHTVGAGSAPNRTLLSSAARAGRGTEVHAWRHESIDAAVGELLQATRAPILTDVSIEGSAVRAVAPKRPRDVLAGQPLVTTMELAADGGTVVVRGRIAGANEEWSTKLDVAATGGASSHPSPEPAESDIPVGALFGRAAIEDGEMRLAAARYDQGQSILDAIEALGLRHRLASRRTSLVAVAETPTVDPRAPRRRERLAVELPAGVSAEGVGLSLMEACLGRRSFTTLEEGMPRSASLGILADIPSAVRRAMTRGTEDTTEPPVSVEGRCTRLEESLLVIELVSPHDGFRVPRRADRVRLRIDGGSMTVTVDETLSSHRGPHRRGLVVRLAVRLRKPRQWAAHAASIEWAAPAKRSAGKRKPQPHVTTSYRVEVPIDASHFES